MELHVETNTKKQKMAIEVSRTPSRQFDYEGEFALHVIIKFILTPKINCWNPNDTYKVVNVL